MSDKSKFAYLVSLLSMLFTLVVPVDTTLAAGQRDDENPSEGYKYFVCIPEHGFLAYKNGRAISGECGASTHYECRSYGDCSTEKWSVGPMAGCDVPITLDFDKFTPDGGSLKFEKFRTSDQSGVLVKQQYEIDRATGSYESIEQIETGRWTITNRGHCKIVRKKLKY